MLLSDATNKNGLVQEIEFWTNLGDGTVSGNADLLKVFVNRLNRAYDRVLPLILSMDDTMQWDDPNHTDHPIARATLTSGQQDYAILTDEDGNSVLNVVRAFVLQSTTAVDYVELDRVPVGTDWETRILNPNAAFVGIPSKFVERGSSLFLGAIPNYTIALGLKLMFERSPSYFSASTLTKKPGIPEPFHPLLALHASKDWLSVNKTETRLLIAEVKEEIVKAEAALRAQHANRFPKRKRVTAAPRRVG